MKTSEMRVFQGLINFGTQAGMFAEGLREQGIFAESYVWEDSFKRQIDVVVSDSLSKYRLIRWVQKIELFIKCFRKFNVFHFYYGRTFFPKNRDLPLYHMFGKKVVMEYLGTDVDLWLGYNGVDWRGRPVDRVKLVKRVIKQSKQVDRQLVCAPHLYQFVDNSIILPLTIDITKYSYSERNVNYGNITFMHCPTNKLGKKTKEIEDAINKLRSEGYIFNYKRIENVTHAQLKEEYKSSDVVIDQLNAWYGTVSVEAMAIGRPVVCGINNSYKLFDDRFDNLPIIQADVKNIYSVLKDILDKKYDLELIGRASRKYVENVHSLEAETKQLISIYESL